MGLGVKRTNENNVHCTREDDIISLGVDDNFIYPGILWLINENKIVYFHEFYINLLLICNYFFKVDLLFKDCLADLTPRTGAGPWAIPLSELADMDNN